MGDNIKEILKIIITLHKQITLPNFDFTFKDLLSKYYSTKVSNVDESVHKGEENSWRVEIGPKNLMFFFKIWPAKYYKSHIEIVVI